MLENKNKECPICKLIWEYKSFFFLKWIAWTQSAFFPTRSNNSWVQSVAHKKNLYNLQCATASFFNNCTNEVLAVHALSRLSILVFVLCQCFNSQKNFLSKETRAQICWVTHSRAHSMCIVKPGPSGLPGLRFGCFHTHSVLLMGHSYHLH